MERKRDRERKKKEMMTSEEENNGLWPDENEKERHPDTENSNHQSSIINRHTPRIPLSSEHNAMLH